MNSSTVSTYSSQNEIQLTCDTFFLKYPLDFVVGLKDSDKKLIFESIKSFKNPQYRENKANFLDGHDLSVVAEFFSRYGESIR